MMEDIRTIGAAELLESYGLGSIQQTARQHGIDTTNPSKTKLVPLLASRLYDPAAIAASLAKLEPRQRKVLNQLILSGGQTRARKLERVLAYEGIVEPAETDAWGRVRSNRGNPTHKNQKSFVDIVARLGVLGLVFSTNLNPHLGKIEHSTPGAILFIPNQVLRHLPSVSLSVPSAPTPARVYAADGDALHRDLYTLLALTRERPLVTTKAGLLGKKALVQLDQLLRRPEGAARVRSENELTRIPLLRAIAQGLGLLVPVNESLDLGDNVRAYFAQPSGVRRRLAYEAYRDSTRWTELIRLPGVTVSPAHAAAGKGVATARARVLAAMAGLPASRWIAIDHLVNRLRRVDEEFLLTPPQHAGAHAYYNYWWTYEPSPHSGYNQLGLRFDGDWKSEEAWQHVEGGFIRVMLAGALHALGIVDLGGPDESSPPTVFRITPEGAALLAGGTPPLTAAPPDVVIQPNFQILALPPTGDDVLWTLGGIAHRVRAEQVVEFQLTRESVYAAQRNGIDAKGVLAFLEDVSRGPLPQNIRRSIEDWGVQQERITIHRGTGMIQSIDGATLDALYADPALKGILGKRLSSTAALVPGGALPALVARLVRDERKRGHPLPALSAGDYAVPAPLLSVESDGRIEFRQRVPSIYVRARLSGFTESEDNGSLRITPASLRRGAKRGLSADDVIGVLQGFHRGELPPEIDALIRRWARDWGRGVLTEVAVLQVESAAVLAELLADPEMGAFLSPLPGAETVAAVNRKDAERLRALLREHGMELGDRLASG